MSIVIILSVCVLVFCCLRRYKRKKAEEELNAVLTPKETKSRPPREVKHLEEVPKTAVVLRYVGKVDRLTNNGYKTGDVCTYHGSHYVFNSGWEELILW